MLLASLLNVAVSSQSSLPAEEYEALVALYNSTNGPSWSQRDGWLSGQRDPCTWQGVHCLRGVSSIELEGCRLNGSLPAELGNLANLEILNLAGNRLTGRIPRELADLASLRVLDLSRNQLNGTIPVGLGKLTVLTSLNLSDNELSGPIPPALGSVSRLTRLNLANNRLQGRVPALLLNHRWLWFLDLSGNSLSGSLPAPELPSGHYFLKELYLQHNQLSGRVPEELSVISSLDQLDLSHNRLSGHVPVELGRLPSLKRLDLSHNQLSGSIPERVAGPHVVELDLSSNRLMGSIPARIGGPRVLDLSSNQLSGSIPKELADLAQLEELSLHSNQLTGSVPIEVANISSLEKLYLHSNRLGGSCPTDALVGRIRFEDEVELLSELGKLATGAESDFLLANELLGNPHSTADDLLAAAALYSRMLDRAPSFDVAVRRRGIALSQAAGSSEADGAKERAEEAEACLEQAASLRRSPENLYWLARSIALTGARNAAAQGRILALVEEIVAANPADCAALDLAAEAATALHGLHSDSTAASRVLALARRAADSHPKSVRILVRYGRAARDAGDWEALRALSIRMDRDLHSHGETRTVLAYWQASPEQRAKLRVEGAGRERELRRHKQSVERQRRNERLKARLDLLLEWGWTGLAFLGFLIVMTVVGARLPLPSSTRILRALLGLGALGALVGVLAGISELHLLNRLEAGVTAELERSAEINDLTVMMIGVSQLGLYLITACWFLLWLHRATKCACAIAPDLQSTPGWAVGWYFVPVANLWKPFQSMKELSQVSRNPKEWWSVGSDGVLVAWWTLWILAGITGNVSLRLTLAADSLPALVGASAVSTVWNAVHLPLCIVAASLVGRIGRSLARLASDDASMPASRHPGPEGGGS